MRREESEVGFKVSSLKETDTCRGLDEEGCGVLSKDRRRCMPDTVYELEGIPIGDADWSGEGSVPTDEFRTCRDEARVHVVEDSVCVGFGDDNNGCPANLSIENV